MHHSGRIRTRSLIALSLLALAGCEGSTGADDEPPRLTITGARTINALGDTVHVGLTATDGDGRVLDTSGAVWTSSNPQVATAPSTLPAIRSVGVGTTIISTTLGRLTASVPVEVRQVPATIRVGAPFSPIVIGQTVTLSAIVMDSMNYGIPAAASEWASSLPDVGSVTPSGMLTGVGPGRTRITVRAAGMHGGNDMEVVFVGVDNSPPEPSRFRVSFSPAAISATGADSIVTATIAGEDDGRGVGTVALRVGKEAAVYACTMTNPSTGNGQRGTWTCPIRRGVLAGPGIYRVHELTVRDTYGQGFTATAESLEASGKQAYFTVNP